MIPKQVAQAAEALEQAKRPAKSLAGASAVCISSFEHGRPPVAAGTVVA
jgi:hypothetical protein